MSSLVAAVSDIADSRGQLGMIFHGCSCLYFPRYLYKKSAHACLFRRMFGIGVYILGYTRLMDVIKQHLGGLPQLHASSIENQI